MQCLSSGDPEFRVRIDYSSNIPKDAPLYFATLLVFLTSLLEIVQAKLPICLFSTKSL